VTNLAFDIYLRAAPEHVLKALSDSAMAPLERFGMSFSAESTGTEAPDDRLAFEWLQTDHLATNGGRQSVASFELTPMGEVTRLSLVHRDLTPDGSLLRLVAAGWPMLLSSLKSLIETGEPLTFRERLPRPHTSCAGRTA